MLQKEQWMQIHVLKAEVYRSAGWRGAIRRCTYSLSQSDQFR
ncbi:hypothetical protein PCO31110_02914 [Pandoraea communis]|uniref:Uncharacterized protein n=1 Tax=Pandoraea communis TaxID=2508297 RepID=A0A5E4VWJ5_9BURK|nr:hypothetical protein PCO31110_02914 [Pandoraea communis]